MSSLVVAVALCDTNIHTEKHMEILQKNSHLFNLPSLNRSVPVVEEYDLNINQHSTEIPEQDEFDMFNANTPKKFAVMVKQTNQIPGNPTDFQRADTNFGNMAILFLMNLPDYHKSNINNQLLLFFC